MVSYQVIIDGLRMLADRIIVDEKMSDFLTRIAEVSNGFSVEIPYLNYTATITVLKYRLF